MPRRMVSYTNRVTGVQQVDCTITPRSPPRPAMTTYPARAAHSVARCSGQAGGTPCQVDGMANGPSGVQRRQPHRLEPVSLDLRKPGLGARAELAKGVVEDPSASNPEIEKYFPATRFGLRSDTAWCAAFVELVHGEQRQLQSRRRQSSLQPSIGSMGVFCRPPGAWRRRVTFPQVEGSSGHVGFVTVGLTRSDCSPAINRTLQASKRCARRTSGSRTFALYRWLDWK